jgi:hypothetical protein
VRMTAEWYKAYYLQPRQITTTTRSQIEAYTSIAKHQGLVWAQ